MRTRERTRELRRAWRGRTSRPEAVDVAYRLYLVAIIALFLVAPAVAVVIDALSTRQALATLGSAASTATLVTVVGLAWAALAWFGGLYGPVVLDPAHVVLWAGTDLPRRAGLRRALVSRGVWLAVLASAVAGLVVGAMLRGGLESPGSAAALVLASAAAGAGGSVLWLAGQVAGRFSWVLGAGLAALTALASALRPGEAPALAAIGILALLSALVAPTLLDRLRGPDLLASATRWQSVSTMARYADVPGALGSLRALPRRGRRWRAVTAGGPARRFAFAGLVGASRTTGRFVTGTLVLAGAAGVLALAPQLPAGPLVGGIGALLGYLALGVFCDGLRHASELAIHPALYGYGRWRTFALHALTPLAMLALAGAGGLGLAAAVDDRALVLGPVLVLPILLMVRVWDSAKGQLPVALLAPVPTPIGDLSGLNVLAWLSDAPLASILAGALVTANLTGGRPMEAALVAAASVGLLLLGLRRRIGND